MDPEIKKAIDQMKSLAGDLTSNTSRIQEIAKIEKEKTTAVKSRFVKGAMVSLMGDGSVNVKFDTPEAQENFYNTALNE